MPKAKFADRGKAKPKSMKSKKVISGKRELSRMGKRQKAGHAGTAVEYIGRTKVIKELQITIADFRKLCILKGIYPRDPKSKRHLDPHQTYYHYKDVSYLRHEPLLRKFRETKSFMKKLKRAIGRNELPEARRLYDSRPVYTLEHLVKERYPRFEDAVSDLDDPLSLVNLFAALPSMDPVKPTHTGTARRLSREWSYYVARSHSLKKVFLSIKGVYFQADVKGTPVTWLVPWPFAQTPPADVDYRVMLTFLELSEVVLRFTLYKLFHGLGLAYPPAIRTALEEDGQNLAALDVVRVKDKGASESSSLAPSYKAAAVLAMPDTGVSAIPAAVTARMANVAALKEVMRQIAAESEDSPMVVSAGASAGAVGAASASAATTAASNAATACAAGQARGKGKRSNLGPSNMEAKPVSTSMYDFVDSAEGEEEEMDAGDMATFAAEDAAAQAALKAVQANRAFQRLFKGLVFFLGREIPRDVFEFLICAFSGRVGWDGPGSPYAVTDNRITHQVVDRPMPPAGADKVDGREYVQPQWVADCVNAHMLLPVSRYAVGASLPPHLSPFVDDSSEGHMPAYRQELDRLRAAAAVTGRLADVLSAAQAEAGAVPKDAAGKVNRLGVGADDEEEEDEVEEQVDDEELEEEDDGEEEDDEDDEEEDEDEEDAEAILNRASAGPAAKRAKVDEGASSSARASTTTAKPIAALEGERRTLAASMLTGNKKRAYEAGMAERAKEEARMASLAEKAKRAAAAGDSGMGSSSKPALAKPVSVAPAALGPAKAGTKRAR